MNRAPALSEVQGSRDGSSPAEFPIARLLAMPGQELGVSDWVAVSQQAVDLFAEATGDHQWIHFDVERCRRESPYGGTIAHGLYTLSLLPTMISSVCRFSDARLVLNYGFNKVRFTAVVPVGGRVRARLAVAACEEIESGAQLLLSASIELEGTGKPVCHAEAVLRLTR